jgi:hypothetical protein
MFYKKNKKNLLNKKHHFLSIIYPFDQRLNINLILNSR